MSRKPKTRQLRKTGAKTERGEDSSAAPGAVKDAPGGRSSNPLSANHPGRKPLPRNRTVAAICIMLVMLVFIVFGQTLFFDFVNYDDNVFVYENHDAIGGLTPGGVM